MTYIPYRTFVDTRVKNLKFTDEYRRCKEKDCNTIIPDSFPGHTLYCKKCSKRKKKEYDCEYTIKNRNKCECGRLKTSLSKKCARCAGKGKVIE